MKKHGGGSCSSLYVWACDVPLLVPAVLLHVLDKVLELVERSGARAPEPEALELLLLPAAARGGVSKKRRSYRCALACSMRCSLSVSREETLSSHVPHSQCIRSASCAWSRACSETSSCAITAFPLHSANSQWQLQEASHVSKR